MLAKSKKQKAKNREQGEQQYECGRCLNGDVAPLATDRGDLRSERILDTRVGRSQISTRPVIHGAEC